MCWATTERVEVTWVYIGGAPWPSLERCTISVGLRQWTARCRILSGKLGLDTSLNPFHTRSNFASICIAGSVHLHTFLKPASTFCVSYTTESMNWKIAFYILAERIGWSWMIYNCSDCRPCIRSEQEHLGASSSFQVTVEIPAIRVRT